MAKRKKLDWQDLVIWLILVLLILTNVCWLLVTRELRNRIDTKVNTLSAQSIKYKDLTDCLQKKNALCKDIDFQQLLNSLKQ